MRHRNNLLTMPRYHACGGISSMARPSLSDPRYYLKRHESWLAFNRRVLEEALDEGNPLLEHSRIFYFANGGEPDIYLGSADWMPRNLYERVEVMFPVKDEPLRNRIFDEILQNYLRDNEKTRILYPDGSYRRAYQSNGAGLSRANNRFSAQAFFVDLAEGRSDMESTGDDPKGERTPGDL